MHYILSTVTGGEAVLLNPEGMKPIYVQIAEWLESEILNKNLAEDERIYSQYQLAEMFNINPATAAKGLNLLLEESTIYKKRGLGMFVAPDARRTILEKRRTQVLGRMISDLIAEASRLNVDEPELIERIRQENKKRGRETSDENH